MKQRTRLARLIARRHHQMKWLSDADVDALAALASDVEADLSHHLDRLWPLITLVAGALWSVFDGRRTVTA